MQGEEGVEALTAALVTTLATYSNRNMRDVARIIQAAVASVVAEPKAEPKVGN